MLVSLMEVLQCNRWWKKWFLVDQNFEEKNCQQMDQYLQLLTFQSPQLFTPGIFTNYNHARNFHEETFGFT